MARTADLQTCRPVCQVLRVSFCPPSPPAAQLSCLPHLFQAVIDRGYLRRLGYSSWDVHLNDELCRPQVTGRYLIFNIPYGRCGTVQQVRRRRGGGTLLWVEAKERGFKIQPPAKNLDGRRGESQAVTSLEIEFFQIVFTRPITTFIPYVTFCLLGMCRPQSFFFSRNSSFHLRIFCPRSHAGSPLCLGGQPPRSFWAIREDA